MASSEAARVCSASIPRLLPGLVTVDGSRFRKAVCKFVMLPRNMPESYLDDLSPVSCQHVLRCVGN
jgi:hypothetical protein